MKLYMHPISTSARPIRLLLAEHGIACEEEFVDLMVGAHHQPPYCEINPNRLVPMLEEDDGWRLTESSAILKYLAEKYDLPEYPKDLRARAKVNEAMDWINTQFYRDFGYGLVYPQLFPHHKRRSAEAQDGTVEWGRKGAERWLGVLDAHWIGAHGYIGGDRISIADYLASGIVSVGELVGCEFNDYPNIRRWLGNMKQLAHWAPVHQVFDSVVAGNRGKQFVRV